MKEYIVIGFLVWFFIGAVRFLINLEQEDLELEVTGLDRILALPFFLVARIIKKIKYG